MNKVNLKNKSMFSPAYNAAVEYAAAVVKAVKESGCEMDYPLEQQTYQYAPIGETLLVAIHGRSHDLRRN